MSMHTTTSTNLTPTFGDLRALMQRPPSHATWRALVGMFEVWGMDVESELVQYARSHLSTWPSELKRAPATWLRCVLDEGVAPPLLSACTALYLGDKSEARHAHAQLHELAKFETLFDELHILRAPYQWKRSDDVVDFLLAPWCASLRTLDLEGTPLGVERLSRLTVLAMHLTRLTDLGLCHTALHTHARRDPDALLRVLRSGLCRRLTRLDLSHNRLGWGTGELLAAGLSGHRRLQELDLSRCDFVSADMSALGQMTGELTTLRRLDLGYNHLSGEALDEFITQSRGANLETLHIQGNDADLDTVNALARHLGLVHLTLGEAEDFVSHAETLDIPYDGLEHLVIHGRLEPVWLHLFEDADALPDLTTLELLGVRTRAEWLEDLLDFVETSSLRVLHIESLTANQRICEILEAASPPRLAALRIDEIRGADEWRARLIGIDWIVDALISS